MADDIQPNESDTSGALDAWANEEPTEPEKKAAAEHAPPKEDESEREEPERKAAPEKKAESEKAPKKEEPAAPRTYKVKVSGKEEDVPAEALEAAAKALRVDPGLLARGAQMFRAGQEKAREAAEKEKAAREMVERLKKDPKAALREALGGDDEVAKLAIAVVNDLMEAEKLQKENPTELERRKAAAELEKLKREREEIAKKAETEEAERYQEQIGEKIGQQMRAALEAGKLPKDPYVVKRLAALMHDAVNEENVDDLSIEDFLPLVVDEMASEHSQFVGNLSGEDFIERFPETAEKVRAAFAERAKGKKPQPPPRQPNGDARPEPKKRPRAYGIASVMDDWVKNG